MLTPSRSLALHAESGRELPRVPAFDAIYRRGVRPRHGEVGWTEDGASYQGLTHRVVYIAARGPVPVGYDVHHKCFNRRCVNIEHLEAIPAFQNRRRHNGQDWELGACKNGHDDSQMIQVGAKRRCGPCYRAQMKVCYARYRAKRKEEPLSADAE